MIEARPATDNSQTFNGLLDEIRRRKRFTSDYQLAKAMGWSTARLSNWRAGKAAPNEEVCAAVAGELDVSPLYVLGVVKLEHETSEQLAPVWRALVKMTKSAAVTSVAVLAAGAVQPAPAASSAIDLTTYTLCARRRRDPLRACRTHLTGNGFNRAVC